MIEITTARGDWTGAKITKFSDVASALRFGRKMKRGGYLIVGIMCDDPEDAEYLMEKLK